MNIRRRRSRFIIIPELRFEGRGNRGNPPLVGVGQVQDISSEDYVERDLMLIKVKAAPGQRMEIVLLVEMFRARVVDVSPNDLMIEISGQERKIEAFIDLMRPYGIVELARTGRIALVRGTPGQGDVL